MSELGEQEEAYAHGLDEARSALKVIRNTEKSVQPSRDSKSKIADEIQKLKFKEPESTRLVVLEQELVRAEAENLVAEAQLSNVVSVFFSASFYYDSAFFSSFLEPPDSRLLMLLFPRPGRSSRRPSTPSSSQRSNVPKSR